MTKVTLLECLRDFTEAAVKDLILPVSPPEDEDGGTAPPRAPLVFLMDLPEYGDAVRKAPYILHQAVTGKDLQSPGQGLPDATAVVRTVFCLYHEDRQEGALALLGLMERLRIALLEQVVIGQQFKLDLQIGLESLVYPSDDLTKPYYIGEMVSTWQLPGIARRIHYGKEDHRGYPGGRR